MPLSPPALRRFVRRVLVDATGVASPEQGQLVSAFDALCGQLHRQLQPLFGKTAVDALFVRAVHVAAAEFPWLRELVEKEPCRADRMVSLAGIEIDTLEEGMAAVFAHNIGLLAAFVGEDLVLPLVQQAWGVVGASRTEGEP